MNTTMRYSPEVRGRSLQLKYEMWQQIVDNVPVALVYINPGGRVEWVNRQWERMLGWSLEESRSHDIAAQMYPDPEDRQKVLQFALAGSGKWGDFRTRTKDGRTIDTSWANVLLSNGASIGVGLDVTERKHLYQSLKKHETLLNEMGRMAVVGGWEFDLAMPGQSLSDQQQVWTDELYRILEVGSNSNYVPTVGKSLDFYTPGSRPIVERAVERAIADGTPFDLELELTTARGNHRWVRAIGKTDREHRRICGTFQNITQRKQNEIALTEATKRLNTLIEASPLALITLNRDGIVTTWNSAAERMFGWSRDEAVGRYIPIIPDDQQDQFNSLIRSQFEGVRYDGLELIRRRKDGSKIAVKLWTAPLFDGSGKIASVVKLFEDITERRQQQEALRESKEKLHAAWNDRARLSRDLHDDTIQSLYAVGMGLQRIRCLVTEDAHRARTELADAVFQLDKVIRRIREHIVGMEGDDAHSGPLYDELQALLHALSSGYAMRFQFDANPHVLSALFPKAGYEVVSIVGEAVSNSLRHSAGTRGLVSVSEREGRVLLAIEDDGIGFDVLNPPRSGQGLRNIAARAQLLGARLDIRSSPGAGTRIEVDMPAEQMHVGD